MLPLIRGVQLLNTAGILLILNARIDSNVRFFRSGRHRDFNPEWYDSVGVSITVTMMINIVAPHVAPILKHFVFTFRRCHDRGCSLSDTSRTKCVTQNQLNRLQVS